MSTFLGGAIAGGIGGIVIALLINFVLNKNIEQDGPLPGALFISKYIGHKDPREYQKEGLVISVVYACLLGGIISMLFAGIITAMGMVILVGLLIGGGVGIINEKVWMQKILGIRMDWGWKNRSVSQSRIKFMFTNIIYGMVVLGIITYGGI